MAKGSAERRSGVAGVRAPEARGRRREAPAREGEVAPPSPIVPLGMPYRSPGRSRSRAGVSSRPRPGSPETPCTSGSAASVQNSSRPVARVRDPVASARPAATTDTIAATSTGDPVACATSAAEGVACPPARANAAPAERALPARAAPELTATTEGRRAMARAVRGRPVAARSRHVPAARSPTPAAAPFGHRVLQQHDVAGGGPDQAQKQPDQGGLACAVRSQEPDAAAGGDVRVDAGDGRPAPEAAFEAACVYGDCHAPTVGRTGSGDVGRAGEPRLHPEMERTSHSAGGSIRHRSAAVRRRRWAQSTP